MQQALLVLGDLVPHSLKAWDVIVGSGASVAILLQLVRHFGKLQEAKKTVTLLLGVFSFASSFADGYIAYAHQHPELLQAASMGWILTAAVIVHRFMVSPVYGRIMDFRNGVYADAMAYRQQQAAVKASTIIAPNLEHEFTVPL